MSRIDLNVALIAPESEILIEYCAKTNCSECLCKYQCDMVCSYGKTLNTMFSKKLDFVPCDNLPVLDFNNMCHALDRAGWNLASACQTVPDCSFCPTSTRIKCKQIDNIATGTKRTYRQMLMRIKAEDL